LATKIHTKLAFGFEILVPKILYQKCVHKTLMKLTPAEVCPNVYAEVNPLFDLTSKLKK